MTAENQGATIMPFTPARERQERPRSITETRCLTLAERDSWRRPPFQRPIKQNPKVMALAEELKTNGGVISSIITLGQLPGDDTLYIVDGLHRLRGAELSGLAEIYVDVRTMQFETMGEMAEEFVRLNSSLNKMKTDDILRGQEQNDPLLHRVRELCPFVGYDNVRRVATGNVMLSMSATLRCWAGSANETPGVNNAVPMLASENDLQKMCAFLNCAYEAWGNDPEYYRLWGNVNLVMCMWLYRQLVLQQQMTPHKRYTVLTPEIFVKCLMLVSANKAYSDWLNGRHIERDRAPAYRRLRDVFNARLKDEFPRKPRMPQPAWFTHKT